MKISRTRNRRALAAARGRAAAAGAQQDTPRNSFRDIRADRRQKGKWARLHGNRKAAEKARRAIALATMLGLRLAHPAPLGLRRGVVQVARARPTRLQCARRAIPLCTATPGGGKGDAQSRRRNATPRVEPVPADPLTEAAAKQTSRLKKELAEVRPPAPSPAPEAQPNPEWEAWEQYFASCDRAGYLISALEVRHQIPSGPHEIRP